MKKEEIMLMANDNDYNSPEEDIEKFQDAVMRRKLQSHYYGDIVRKLLMAAAVLMLFDLPFFSARLPVSILGYLAFIVFIGIIAGITNPRVRWIFIVNTFISIISVLVFEYYTIILYQGNGGVDLLFLSYQIKSLIFLAALYYSTKTLRAMVLEDVPHIV